MNRLLAITLSVFLIASAQAQSDLPFNVEPITSFDEPWALAFLPDGRMLVTERKGSLFIVGQDGEKSRRVGGVPDVDYGGQGGLGDVALHPDIGKVSAAFGFVQLAPCDCSASRTAPAAFNVAQVNQPVLGGRILPMLDCMSWAGVNFWRSPDEIQR